MQDNIQILLDVASEQANRELLLQKHFFALLSSARKVASHVDRRQNPHATSNGLYFDQAFFTSIGQHSQYPLNKPSERTTFANSAQSKKLLEAALEDMSRPANDKTFLSNQGGGMPVSAEQVDITLEFPKEESDSLSSFPSVIKLSIKGDEALPSLNKHTRDDHLKSCFSAAESRFRYG